MNNKPKVKLLSPTEKEVQAIQPEHRFIKKVNLTGHGAVDMLQIAIKYHQDRFISLRSIALKPKLYELFFDYMNEKLFKSTQGKRDLNKSDYMLGNATLVFFDVDIKVGSKFQKDDMYFEEYFQSHEKKEKKQAIFSDKIRPSFH